MSTLFRYDHNTLRYYIIKKTVFYHNNMSLITEYKKTSQLFKYNDYNTFVGHCDHCH